MRSRQPDKCYFFLQIGEERLAQVQPATKLAFLQNQSVILIDNSKYSKAEQSLDQIITVTQKDIESVIQANAGNLLTLEIRSSILKKRKLFLSAVNSILGVKVIIGANSLWFNKAKSLISSAVSYTTNSTIGEPTHEEHEHLNSVA